MECDDDIIASINVLDGNFPEHIQRCCYVLVYDVVSVELKTLLNASVAMESLLKTTAFQHISKVTDYNKPELVKQKQIVTAHGHKNLFYEAVLIINYELEKSTFIEPLSLSYLHFLIDLSGASGCYTSHVNVVGKCSTCERHTVLYLKVDCLNLKLHYNCDPHVMLDELYLHILEDKITPCCFVSLDSPMFYFSSVPKTLLVTITGLHVNYEIVKEAFSMFFTIAFPNTMVSLIIAFILQDAIPCSTCYIIGINVNLIISDINLTILSPNTLSMQAELEYNDDKSVSKWMGSKSCGQSLQSNKFTLRAEEIDNYMELVRRCSILKVRPVPLNWIQQYFDKEDLLQPETLHTSWYNSCIVIVPFTFVNEWKLYVIDFNKSIIFFIEHISTNSTPFHNILLRILALEHHIHFQSPINFSCWKLCNISLDNVVTNGSKTCSSGEFICMVAKALVFQKKFLFNTSKMRQTILKELQVSSLIGIKHADDLLNDYHFSYKPLLPIAQYVPVQYHYVISPSILSGAIAFSYNDETKLRESGLAYNRVVYVTNYTDNAYVLPLMNLEGQNVRAAMNPNVFNLLVRLSLFDRVFTEEE